MISYRNRRERPAGGFDGSASRATRAADVKSSDRCHLDREARSGDPHLQRGVIQIAAVTPIERRGDRLEHDAVESDRVAARAQRQPEEVDRGLGVHPVSAQRIDTSVDPAPSIAAGPVEVIGGNPHLRSA